MTGTSGKSINRTSGWHWQQPEVNCIAAVIFTITFVAIVSARPSGYSTKVPFTPGTLTFSLQQNSLMK